MKKNFRFFSAVLCGLCALATTGGASSPSEPPAPRQSFLTPATGGASSPSEPPAPRQSFPLTLATNGDVSLGGAPSAPDFGLLVFREGWTGTFTGAPILDAPPTAAPDGPSNSVSFLMKDATGNECVKGTVSLAAVAPLTASLTLRATVLADVRCERVAMEFSLPAKDVAGLEWRIGDAARGVFPERHGETRLFYGMAESLSFVDPETRKPVELRFARPMNVLLQDSRLWGPNFSFRMEVPIEDCPQTPNVRQSSLSINNNANPANPANSANPVEKNPANPVEKPSSVLSKGAEIAFDCTISHPDGIEIKRDRLVFIQPSEDWIRLDPRKNIVEGSALDFSNFAQCDAPAGKHGFLKAVGDHFEFEGLPGVPQRFYGVNLCNDANYPDAALADELVVRLKRLGYNAIRIHHHDGAWAAAYAARQVESRKSKVESRTPDVGCRPANVGGRTGDIRQPTTGDKRQATSVADDEIDRLDYLLAKCFEAGIYATTDLYVSRPVAWRDIGFDRDGNVPGNVFKNLVALHEPAFENWKAFASSFLLHENPCTGRRYADEPGLVTINLVNEGTMSWAWNTVKKLEPAKEKWREWKDCQKRQSSTNGANVNPANPANPVEKPSPLPDDPAAIENYLDSAAAQCFAADMERASFERQKAFLQSLGCKALLSSQNCADSQAMASARDAYDYVDNHFYHGNPKFLGKMWSAPFGFPNGNPVKADNLSLVNAAYTRLAGKPCTITEWNFSGPNRHRAAGALLVGAMAARQEWDGLWRFAYSHVAKAMRDGAGAPHLFDVASDALNQASERAVMALFLRGDMAPLENKVALDVGPARLTPDDKPPVNRPDWMDEAWNVQVGRTVSNDTIDHKSSLSTTINHNPVTPENPANPVEENCPVEENSAPPREASWAVFPLETVVSAPPVTPSPRSDLILDRGNGTVAIDTPRTCGGFAESGTIKAGALHFELQGDTRHATSDKPEDECRNVEMSPRMSPVACRLSKPASQTPPPVAATVFAISLDGIPLSDSSRILVTHLTDAQKQGNVYADEAKSVLLRWGGETTLVHSGKARISIALRDPESCEVWGLATDGTRMERVDATAESGMLAFTADVDSGRGARLLYEIVRRKDRTPL